MSLPDGFDVALLSADKVYNGIRQNETAVHCFVRCGRVARKLEPTGTFAPAFEWGYGGSGPHELARAVLADYLDVAPPHDLVSDFAVEVLARSPHAGFLWFAGDMRHWLGPRLGSLG